MIIIPGCLRAVDKQFGRIKAPIYLAGTGPVRCQYNVTWVQPGLKRIVSFNRLNLKNGTLNVTSGDTEVSITGECIIYFLACL